MSHKITLKNILGYASINFLGSGAQTLISAWLMYFYTTFCNMSVVQAGIIFTVARIVDAIGNPIIGFISDNLGRVWVGKRFGRRKFFILLGVPLILIIFPILWTTGHSYSFYFGTNLIYEIIFTMVAVSGGTLPAEMAEKSIDKTKLVAGKQYCGTIAGAVATFIPAQLFVHFGKNNPDAFLYTGIIYAVMISISLLLVYLWTFERNISEIVYDNKIGNISQIFKQLCADIVSSLKLKAFRSHSIMLLLGCIYKQLASGIFTYFVIFVLCLSSITTAYIISFTTIISLTALTFFIFMAYKFGGPKTYRWSTLIVLVSLIGYYILTFMTHSMHIVEFLIILAVINTMGKTGIDYVPVFQLSFIPDIDEALTGMRREGIYSGVNSLFTKMAAAIEGAILGIMLGTFGFEEGVHTQTASAINGITFVTVLLPIILLIIGCIGSYGLKLTNKKHKILCDEINRLKTGGDMKNASNEVRDVFYELTGYPYEQCWGKNNVTSHQKIRLNN